MSDDNFWDDLGDDVFLTEDTTIDQYLTGPRVAEVRSVRALFEGEQHKSRRPFVAGTRVGFITTLSSLLSYEDCPDRGTEGTVVTVRSAGSDSTTHEGKVFVMWDDGKFRSVHAEHLKPVRGKQATNVRMTVSNLGDLRSFFKPASNGSDDLIHKATKDLWSVKRTGENFVIERLFDETGKPLKV